MNIIKEVKENERRIKHLEGKVFSDPDEIEAIRAVADGTTIMATDYIMTANFKQQDIAIFNRKIAKIEQELIKIKKYINLWLS